MFTLRRMRTKPEKHGEGPKVTQLGLRRIVYRKAALDTWLAERESLSTSSRDTQKPRKRAQDAR